MNAVIPVITIHLVILLNELNNRKHCYSNSFDYSPQWNSVSFLKLLWYYIGNKKCDVLCTSKTPTAVQSFVGVFFYHLNLS